MEDSVTLCNEDNLHTVLLCDRWVSPNLLRSAHPNIAFLSSAERLRPERSRRLCCCRSAGQKPPMPAASAGPGPESEPGSGAAAPWLSKSLICVCNFLSDSAETARWSCGSDSDRDECWGKDQLLIFTGGEGWEGGEGGHTVLERQWLQKRRQTMRRWKVLLFFLSGDCASLTCSLKHSICSVYFYVIHYCVLTCCMTVPRCRIRPQRNKVEDRVTTGQWLCFYYFY